LKISCWTCLCFSLENPEFSISVAMPYATFSPRISASNLIVADILNSSEFRYTVLK
jgi:hypothetical protein